MRAPSQIGAWLNARISVLAPGWTKAMFLGVPLARSLRFDPAADKLRSRRGRLIAPLGLLTSDSPAKTGIHRRKRIVDAHVPATLFLKRTITAPLGARMKLGELAALDLRQHTPFRPEDVSWRLEAAKADADHLTATQWVAKRTDLEQWRRNLAGHGFLLRKVFVDGTRLNGPVADFSAHVAPRAKRIRTVNALLAMLAVAAAAVGWVYPSWTAQTQATELQSRLALLRSEAVALRAEVEDLRLRESERAAFLDLLFRRPLLVGTLRELTIALRDDVWLGTVDFRPERVVITGETSGSAADTVLLLSKKPRFGNPRLSGPVSRTASNAERFEITINLGAGG